MHSLLIGFVPLPPSVNKIHRVSARSGKASVYVPQEVKEWKRQATTCLYAAWQDVTRIQSCRDSDTSLYVALTAYMTPAQYQRRDSDNLAKVVLDTVLNEFLAIDDVRVADLHISKRLASKAIEPCLYVSVYEKESLDAEIAA